MIHEAEMRVVFICVCFNDAEDVMSVSLNYRGGMTKQKVDQGHLELGTYSNEST